MTTGSGRRAQVLYPNLYTWLVFVSAMDLMLTVIVIFRGGVEANVLASSIVRRFGLPGMVVFKFFIVTFVISLCEIVGRKNRRAGRLLAGVSIAITTMPVLIGFSLLLTGLRD